MRQLITISLFCCAIAAGLFIVGCSKRDHTRGSGPRTMSFQVPANFPDPVYTFEGNPLTEEGFELGRKLFYDGILSRDGNFPCGSCHQQFAAFATFEHDLSHGFNNQFTTRNAPGLANLVWEKQLHWDGGINHIEVQPLAPITAPNEMAEDVGHVVEKLNQDDTYKKMFKAAFGSGEINSQNMLRALTQFMSMLVSANSKYDKVKRGETRFSREEEAGYQLFQQKCETCHKEPLFTDGSFRNNGMAINPFLKDYGRMRITDNKDDSLKFKVPSLRNVMLTFPYGHDGRFFSIDNVLMHYANGGIRQSTTLDPLLQNGIPLNAEEKYYIKQFLGTLTDSTFITDKRFAE